MDKAIIGDVHGKMDYLFHKIWINQVKESIQIGDLGFKRQHDMFLSSLNTDKHKCLFGNHDYYPYLYENHSLRDYYYDEIKNLIAIRGANSPDKHIRTQGVDWFENEELTYRKFLGVMDVFEKQKPSIVISHDCPQSVKMSEFGFYDQTITNSALENCLEIHQPDIWIFGHYHESKNFVYRNVNFICLDELEFFEI